MADMISNTSGCCKETQIYEYKFFENDQKRPESFDLACSSALNLRVSYSLIKTKDGNHKSESEYDDDYDYNDYKDYYFYLMKSLRVALLNPKIKFAVYVTVTVYGKNFSFVLDNQCSSNDLSTSERIYPVNGQTMQIRVHILCQNQEIHQMMKNYTKLLEKETVVSQGLNFESVNRVLENYNKFLKNEKLSDVRIMVDGKQFPAHKDVLAGHSSVFEKMFETDMLEKKTGNVDLKDIESKIFEHLIHYIYFATVDSENIADWLKIIEAADRFAILSLVKVCENYIATKLDVNNVVDAFITSDKIKSEDLKKQCVRYIVKNKASVLKTEKYQNLVKTRQDLVSEMFIHIMLCCSLTLEKEDE